MRISNFGKICSKFFFRTIEANFREVTYFRRARERYYFPDTVNVCEMIAVDGDIVELLKCTLSKFISLAFHLMPYKC